MMTLARLTMALPAALGRSIHHFLFVPAAQAHPARLEAIVPPGIDAMAGPGAAALLDTLGDAQAHLRLDRIEHRIALLECDAIASLAHFAALQRLGWALRRIVRREERAKLDPVLSADDWDTVYRTPASPGPQSGSPSVSAIIDDLDRAGWELIAQASRSLPAPIGDRLRLKCAPFAAPTLVEPSPSPEACMPSLVALYRQWCERALPGWEHQLSSAAAAAGVASGSSQQ